MVNASYLVVALATAVSGAVIPREVHAVTPTDEAEFTPSEGDFSANFIGGYAVSVKEYPFVIAGLREGGPRPQGQSCTGSVIAPRKIMIAGHCADAQGNKTFAYGYDDLNEGTVKKIPVLSYKKHPKYVNFDQGYDVAVVTTTEDIPVPGGQYAKFATRSEEHTSELQSHS